MPPAALLQLDLADMWWADQGANLLTNPSFETGGNPPTGWTQLQAIDTTETGACPASTGTKVGRVAYDGVNATGFCYQGIGLPNGRRVHLTGWARSDGVGVASAAFDSAVAPLSFPVSTSWAVRENIGVLSAGNICYLMGTSLAAGRWVEWDEVSVYEQFMYTRNRGLLAQSPSTSRIQCGDGRTAATFPTMLNLTQSPRKGCSFNGNQYLQWAQPVANGTYTVCFLIQRTSSTVSRMLLDARAGGGTGFIWVNGAGALAASSGTLYVNEAATSVFPVGPLLFVAVSGITLSAPSFLMFMTQNIFDPAVTWIGNVFGARLALGTLTPRQLNDVRQRMLAEIYSP